MGVRSMKPGAARYSEISDEASIDPGQRRTTGVEYRPVAFQGNEPCLRQAGTAVRFRSGDVLFEPGDHLHGAYYIVSGRVELLLEGGSGRELVLLSVGPGGLVGESSILGRAPSLEWAVAATDIKAVFYDRQALYEQARRDPEILDALLLTLSKKLESVTIRLHNTTFLPLECRVAKFLLAGAAEEEGLGLVTRATHEEIARCTGVCRVAVTNCLKRMERTGLVRRCRGFVILDDTARLVPLACNAPARWSEPSAC